MASLKKHSGERFSTLCPMLSCVLKFEFGQEIEMQKWQCKICGYVYDPGKGDPDGNISPNTPFDKLPDDWVCPVCGAPKDMFEEIQRISDP